MSFVWHSLVKKITAISIPFWSNNQSTSTTTIIRKMGVRDIIEELTEVSIQVRQDINDVTDQHEKEKIALRHIRDFASKECYVNEFQKGLEWFNVSQSLSMRKDLAGKICVLDFFTYCCINCMHILPDLAALEKKYSIEDGLVVIGVHSAKFANEKDSSKILAAVQRYNIDHPVVNDAKLSMWRDIGIVCWPSLVILGPKGQPLFVLVGEGHKEELFLYVRVALAYFKSLNEISNNSLPIEPSQHLLPLSKDVLLFPGKIHLMRESKNKNGDIRIAVADTGNNRILIMDFKGTVEYVIGGYTPGFQDADFENSRFNAPQGICSLGDVIFVADNENHAIRKIDLTSQKVTTLAGTGIQGHDYTGGKSGLDQPLSSPWDVVIHKHNQGEKTVPILLIAIAGTHQLWAYFIEDTTWWKNKFIKAQTCLAIVGNGREENRNNSYPHAASLAQPSGLAISKDRKLLFFADSESSSIRKVDLLDGKVSGVCGADKNPANLHDFGDVDGKQCTAKLQHPLGVAWDDFESVIYIADTYNHKIKKVDLLGNCKTLYGAGKPSAQHKFDEPSGLALHPEQRTLYIADTNNHQIVSISIENGQIETINVNLPSEKTRADRDCTFEEVASPHSGIIQISLNVEFLSDLKLNSEAPQKWTVTLPDDKWKAELLKGDLNTPIKLDIPEGKIESKISVTLDLVTCKTDECIPKRIDAVFVIKRNLEAERNINLKKVIKIK